MPWFHVRAPYARVRPDRITNRKIGRALTNGLCAGKSSGMCRTKKSYVTVKCGMAPPNSCGLKRLETPQRHPCEGTLASIFLDIESPSGGNEAVVKIAK
jgi:hypothetical protein